MAPGLHALMLSVALMMAAAAPATDPDMLVKAADEVAPLAMPGIELEPSSYWQVVIERRVIIRVPARRSPIANFSASPEAASGRAPPPLPIVWKEKKAPKCVAMKAILGMQAVQRDSIDLITRQNQRLRAQLNRGCRALDFYSGFYMKASEDGRLCEDRDSIHARSGAECEVDKFRLMVPVRREN